MTNEAAKTNPHDAECERYARDVVESTNQFERGLSAELLRNAEQRRRDWERTYRR